MSQHHFLTKTSAGAGVSVLMGWDRMLRQYFLVVERLEPQDAVSEDDGGLLYSDINDRAAFRQDLGYFLLRLHQFGITVPGAMLQQVTLDRTVNAGNRCVTYEADGSFIEA